MVGCFELESPHTLFLLFPFDPFGSDGLLKPLSSRFVFFFPFQLLNSRFHSTADQARRPSEPGR